MDFLREICYDADTSILHGINNLPTYLPGYVPIPNQIYHAN